MDSKVPRAHLKRRSADRAAPDPRRRAEGDQNTNDAVAASLREYADLLAHQETDGFRTMAYRRAADILAALDRPVDQILAKDGREGLMALPGIGPSTAGAVAEMLAIGRRRAELIRGLLAERLGRPRLRRIAARREDWEFTALFSNTRLAHELGRTSDWVVIYYHTGATPEGQCTVVMETRGTLAGRRVVRGREQELLAHTAPELTRTPRNGHAPEGAVGGETN